MNFSEKDLRIVFVGALTTLFTCMLISHPVWFTPTTFPIAPLFTTTGFLTGTFQSLVSVLLLASAILLYFRKRISYLLLFTALGILLVVDNQLRLQPWFYIMGIVIFLIGIKLIYKKSDAPSYGVCLLIVSVYFFAGIFKLNSLFFSLGASFLLESLNFAFSNYNTLFINSITYSIPFVEIAVALMLLIPRTRKFGVICALLIHTFVIFFISVKLSWNLVIIPWNLGMMWLVYGLFYDNNLDFKQSFIPNSIPKVILFIFFAIMPLTHFAKIWDAYLSFNLYSYNTINAVIDFTDDEAVSFEKQFNFELTNNQLSLNLWALKELNVPIYPENRVVYLILSDICANTNMNASKIYIGTIYNEMEGFVTNCTDLKR